MGTQIATVTVKADTRVDGYGILAAGTYEVKMPSDYDPSAVTAEDIVLDQQIRIVGPYVLATGGDADEWSRHATLDDALVEAAKQREEWSVWSARDYDTPYGPPVKPLVRGGPERG
jgi:hypothetical protein